MYETSHAQYFLSFLLLCTRFLGSRRRSPSGWMHFYTPPESSGISRNAIIGLGSLRSPAFKPHPIFTRTAHTECYTDRALCSDLFHFLSQPLSWEALSHSHFHTSQSVLIESIVGFIRVFYFQRSCSCKTFWRTVAIVHDVMHCAQHCNQHVGDVWMMTMFAICGRALVVLAAAAVVAYKSLLAKSATTETTSLVLMPCSTEHSGVPFISVEYVMLHWVTLTIVHYIDI